MVRRRGTQPPPMKDHFAESRLVLNRVILALILITILLGFVVSRLIYLQVVRHEHYSTQANDNRVKVLPIPPTRGLIYDRNGIVLAENQPTYRLEITPEQVPDLDHLLAQLSGLIEVRDDDIKRFQRLLKRKRPFDSVPLRFQLTDAEVARIAAVQHRLPGARVSAGLTRHYPLADIMSHVIGYVGRIDDRDLGKMNEEQVARYRGTSHIGKIGIEKRYESVLHGDPGYQQVETNAQGRILRVLQQTPPTPGQDLILSIDAPLQAVAEQALGEFDGALVALDPDNGEVLAMVSKPTYDPNQFVNGISTEAFAALRDDKSQPLYNRALLGRYPPGSTIKPFIGLAGLHHRVVNQHYEQYCPGFYTLPGEERRFRDWKRQGHGSVNLDDAIAESCDVYFYDLARNLGIDRISPFLAKFGFGQPTGVDMHLEKDGLLPSRQWKRRTRNEPWFPGETLNTGIGQGFLLTTPMQLAHATAILATRGQRPQPHLVRYLQNGQHRRALAFKQEPPVQDIKADQWQTMHRAMLNVVHGVRGTARQIAKPNYRIAGKTGTAQVFGMGEEEEYDEEKVAKKLRDHALFIAYAPADAPRIAVAIIAENGGSGGGVAAPIAALVIDHYLAENP